MSQGWVPALASQRVTNWAFWLVLEADPERWKHRIDCTCPDAKYQACMASLSSYEVSLDSPQRGLVSLCLRSLSGCPASCVTVSSKSLSTVHTCWVTCSCKAATSHTSTVLAVRRRARTPPLATVMDYRAHVLSSAHRHRLISYLAQRHDLAG